MTALILFMLSIEIAIIFCLYIALVWLYDLVQWIKRRIKKWRENMN